MSIIRTVGIGLQVLLLLMLSSCGGADNESQSTQDEVSLSVSLTPIASAKIASVMAEHFPGESAYVRVGQNEKGFILDVTQNTSAEDVWVDSQGLRLIATRPHARALAGYTIDWKVIGTEQGFVFQKPSGR